MSKVLRRLANLRTFNMLPADLYCGKAFQDLSAYQQGCTGLYCKQCPLYFNPAKIIPDVVLTLTRNQWAKNLKEMKVRDPVIETHYPALFKIQNALIAEYDEVNEDVFNPTETNITEKTKDNE